MPAIHIAKANKYSIYFQDRFNTNANKKYRIALLHLYEILTI